MKPPFFCAKKACWNLIASFFLVLGAWVIQGTQKVDGAVLPPPIACPPGQYALMCPDTLNTCATTAHIQCSPVIPFFAEKGVCTVANGVADTVDASATSYNAQTYCGLMSDTYICVARGCHDSAILQFMEDSKGDVNGITCTVRKVRNDGSILQDQGKIDKATNECIQCGSAVIGGVTVNNIITAVCGDRLTGPGGIYLDNSTGTCNGDGSNVFSTACNPAVSSLCSGKSYLSNCGACGICDENGQCVVGVGPCVTKAPDIDIAPDSQAGASGSALNYNVTVTNNDRGSCAENFNLTFSVPAGGWSGNLSSASVAPASCASQTVTFTVTSPICAAPGNYNVSVTATGSVSGLVATDTATFQVLPNSLCTLTATPAQIISGNSSQLSWTTVAGITSAVINPGGIAAVPVAGGNVNVTPPAAIGSYTYNMNVTAACGTVNNACSATIQVCAANWGQPCSNACFNGTYDCSGVCNAPPPPADYGNACQSPANACGEINSGTKNCSSQCVDGAGNPVVTPPNPAACQSPPDACGNFGTGYQCPAGCNAVPPPAPPTCESSANSCGDKNSGFVCAGTCNAIPPADPGQCIVSNDCGQTNTGYQCLAGCTAVPPPLPPGYGQPCTAVNACGETANGTTQCDGSCSAYVPPAPAINGGLVPCGRGGNDPNTPWNECDRCDLCRLILMGQLIIEFLVKLAAYLALIFITLGGLIYILAAGNSSRIETGKSMMKYTIIGFIIVFVAWAMVETILITLGYIDPLGGEWYTVCSI